MSKSSLLIYSGGLDSTVLLHQRLADISHCLHFDYGAKHGKQEFHCASLNAEKLGVPLLIVRLEDVFNMIGGALLKSSSAPIPDGHYTDESMKQTVVPFRNGIFLSIAIGVAESLGLKKVLIAAHIGDHTIYPDCRPIFMGLMCLAATMGTYAGVEVDAAFAALDKRAIAMLGRDLGVDFKNTWSCYKGGDLHCGVCGTCVERKEALEGFDPTNYIGARGDTWE
jgi:7-cyano-7-deazaguanine synthase